MLESYTCCETSGEVRFMHEDTPEGGAGVADTATEVPSDAAWERCFSSRRHLARRLENQT